MRIRWTDPAVIEQHGSAATARQVAISIYEQISGLENSRNPGVLVVTPTTPLLGLLAALRPRVLRLLLITVYSCVAALASVGAPDEANAKFG